MIEFNSSSRSGGEFYDELLRVLKKDPDMTLTFRDGLVYRSRARGCSFTLSDVHYSPEKGDVVFVGAFKSGRPVFDDSKGYPIMKTDFEFPFRDVVKDMTESGDDAKRLFIASRQAATYKYVTLPYRKLENAGIVEDGMLRFSDLGVRFSKESGLSTLEAVSVDTGGNYSVTLVDSSDFGRKYRDLGMGQLALIHDSMRAVLERFRLERGLYAEAKASVTKGMQSDPGLDRMATLTAVLGMVDRGVDRMYVRAVAGSVDGLKGLDGRNYDATVRSMRAELRGTRLGSGRGPCL